MSICSHSKYLTVMSNMDIPEYKEKEFLLIVLDNYESDYGKEIRNLSNFVIGVLSLDLKNKFPYLKYDDGSNHFEYLKEWFQEGIARGDFVPHKTVDFRVVFTEEGYKKALRYKNPIKYFCTKHWKWAAGIAISCLSLCSAIVIKLVQCSC